MFESDDWDTDQDFLKDASEIETQFYSQTQNDTEPESAEKRRVETKNDVFLPGSRLCRDTGNSRRKSEQDVNTQSADRSSRTNLILGMFNKSDTNAKSQKLASNVTASSISNPSSDSHSSQRTRKKMLLDILKKEDPGGKTLQKDQRLLTDIKNTKAQDVKPKPESINNTKNEKSKTVMKDNEVKCNTFNSGSKESDLKIFPNKPSTTNKVDDTRRQLLLNAMKPPSVRSTKPTEIIAKRNNFPAKVSQVQTDKKMTLIRRFPGPAGLLPDNAGSSIPPISYLNSLEESENDRLKDKTETSFSDYCSQNTRNLFTEGAWQMMLNDLPPDFLKGYEIATVKRTANSNCCKSAKVQLLAGMLEHIDHSHDNPPIVLKDFTDSIRGIVHRDIPLNYPGILEPNVVLLLHNVGLLRTSGCLMSNKYHALISPSSLLAIYSKNGGTVRTSQLDMILRKSSNETLSENGRASTKTSTRRSFESGSEHFPSVSSDNCSNKFEEKRGFGASGAIFNSINESIDFDDEDDLLISMCCDEVTDSQNERKFAVSKSKVVTGKEDVKKETASLSLLQTLKRFAPDANARKRLPPIPKTSQLNAERPVASIEKRVVNSATNTQEKPLSMEKRASDSSNSQCDVKAKSPRLNVSNSGAKKVAVRSRLLQFKSKDVLSQPVEETKETRDEKSPAKVSSNFEDILDDGENDSDDEIFSQLDVDTICSNYTKESETSK